MTGVVAADLGSRFIRRVGLSMGHVRTGDLRLTGVMKTAFYLNDAMAKNARKYLFFRPRKTTRSKAWCSLGHECASCGAPTMLEE